MNKKKGCSTEDRKETDWKLIQAEYCTGTASLRELAKKHGVAASNICMRSKKEGWVKSVEAIEREISKRVIEHTVQERCSNNERALRCATKLLAKIEGSIELAREKDVSALKGLVASLKDLRDLGVFIITSEDNNVNIAIDEKGDEYAD